MRKTAFISVLLLMTSLCGWSQINWMVRGGYNYGSVKAEYLDKKLSKQSSSGFNLGIGAKTLFDYNLYFTPQFNYSLKGYKVDYGTDSTIRSSATTLHTLEAAILLQMYLNPNASNKVFIQYGPSINFIATGREKVTMPDGSTVKKTLKFGEVYYGHWEASVLANLGIEMSNKWVASVGFNLGLTNIHNSDFGPNLRTRVFTANIGYYFR